jgi:hypothetical protein
METARSLANSSGLKAYWTPICLNSAHQDGSKSSIKNIAFDILTQKYGAVTFLDALADFLIQVNNPKMSGNALCAQASNLLIIFLMSQSSIRSNSWRVLQCKADFSDLSIGV